LPLPVLPLVASAMAALAVGGGHSMLVPILIAYALAPDATTRVLAQTATEAGPYLTLANLGLAGLAIWAFVTGKIHSDKELQRVISRCDDEFKRIVGKLDAAEAELRRRAEEDRTTIVPVLVRSTDTLARILDRAGNTPPPPHKGDARQ
jgi:hypothetical protein